jgi:hypothetical protein
MDTMEWTAGGHGCGGGQFKFDDSRIWSGFAFVSIRVQSWSENKNPTAGLGSGVEREADRSNPDRRARKQQRVAQQQSKVQCNHRPDG